MLGGVVERNERGRYVCDAGEVCDAERVGFGDVGWDSGLVLGGEAVAEGVAGLGGGVVYAVDVGGNAGGDVGGGGGSGGGGGGCRDG